MADSAAPGSGRPDAASAAALRRHLSRIHNSSMLALLVLLVGEVFVAPALVDPYGPSWRLVSNVFILLILLTGVVAVHEHRRLTLVLVALTAAVVVGHSSSLLFDRFDLLVVRDLATLAALFVLSFAVGINVFAEGHALGDRVWGAIVLYLLLGVMWALAYAIISVLQPGAFSADPGHARGLGDWIYFSFVTLTTVGYGDITPVGRAARSLAMLEALSGQLYPAIIIARLVSLQVGSR